MGDPGAIPPTFHATFLTSTTQKHTNFFVIRAVYTRSENSDGGKCRFQIRSPIVKGERHPQVGTPYHSRGGRDLAPTNPLLSGKTRETTNCDRMPVSQAPRGQ